MIKKIGSDVLAYIYSLPYLLGYIGRIFVSAVIFFHREKGARKVLIMQLLFTFIEALPIIAVLSFSLGSALYILGYSFLLSIGQDSLIYNLLTVIVVRELGPLLVAFVVTARSSTAIATELGGMVTSHQIESLVACGIDPIDYLVVPRFIGVTLSVFFLNLYFSFCGLIGPVVVTQFVNPVASYGYVDNLLKTFSLFMLLTSIVKSLLFGMIISITATYYGFNVERASTEIPIAGIQAVSKSFVGIILCDVLIIVLSIL
ncbi:MAG: ABC transporter permease [Treponema sp.]|uniref:ABC transporter permease n=1 Tax=Treponema sp. TaxID=166 RepID=UPI001B541AA8|nr:ABC transporter permease [Treponema sp.]MBP3771610.1 ABC transporter permease [Treponema sp.]MBQ9281522.1 ABC transporter permease [Treponema sp.]